MGFGILFFGYFITYLMAMNPWGCFFRAFGYLAMSSGLVKLSQYNKDFTYSVYASFLLGVINFISSADFIFESLLFSSDPFGDSFMNVLANVETGMVLIYHLLLLFAIRSIAKETEVEKISFAAIRNMIIVVAYFLLSFVKYIPFPLVESYKKNMGLPLFLIYLTWIILDVVLLFSCYSGICDENDREMKWKKSKFEFINQYREELDAREAKALEQAEKYKAQKAEKKKRKK